MFRELARDVRRRCDGHQRASRLSAQVAVAFDEVIKRSTQSMARLLLWGEKEFVTQLRAQSALAVSSSPPWVDLGHGRRREDRHGDEDHGLARRRGMFVEFFSMELQGELLFVRTRRPGEHQRCDGKAKLQHLPVHMAKTGHGLGIDFRIPTGPVTLLNLKPVLVGSPIQN